MELLEIMQNRRSLRKYTGEDIPEDKLQMIIQAGLLGPSSKNKQNAQIFVIKDKEVLEKLGPAKANASIMLSKASVCILTAGDPELSDTWATDCAIAMTQMHLMTDYVGLGSCWIQVMDRLTEDESEASESYIRKFVDIPEDLRLVAMLPIGVPEFHSKRHELDRLKYERVHYL